MKASLSVPNVKYSIQQASIESYSLILISVQIKLQMELPYVNCILNAAMILSYKRE